MARPLPDVMYGTPDGVALDQGAAESVRRLRQPAVNSFTPGSSPAMQPNGSPQAAAFRADQAKFQAEQAARSSLRAGGPSPTAPTAPTAAAKPGVLSRATTGLRNAPGAILEADLAPLAKGVGGAAKNLISGVAGKAALGFGVADAAHTAYNTDTDTYAQRTGIEREATHVPQFAKDLGIRALGTAQDIGNTLTFGLADRVGNLAAGNGFNRSAGNQVGEMFGPGREVGGMTPAAAPTAPPSIRKPFSDVRNGTYGDGMPDLTGKIVRDGMPDLTGKIVRDGNSYSGKDVKFGAEIVNPRNPGVGVSSLDTSEGYRQNLLELQRNAAERANAPATGGTVNMGGGWYREEAQARSRDMDFKRSLDGMSPRQRAAATMQQQELRSREGIAAAQTGATLRGQDVAAGSARYGADTSRANTRDTVGASLRGQDMDYAEKMDSKRLDLAAREAQRRAISSAWQGTTDPGVAAARLAASGYDPASALAVAGGQRASAEASDKNFRSITEAAGATTDKDGKPVLNPALQAVAQNVIANAMPGVRNAAPANQNARLREVQATGSLAAGLQEAQGGSLLQSIGWDKAPPAVTTLPNFQGATLRERGIGSPFANASRGDYELVQPDGTVTPIKRGRVSERELDYMKQQGVSLRN